MSTRVCSQPTARVHVCACVQRHTSFRPFLRLSFKIPVTCSRGVTPLPLPLSSVRRTGAAYADLADIRTLDLGHVCHSGLYSSADDSDYKPDTVSADAPRRECTSLNIHVTPNSHRVRQRITHHAPAHIWGWNPSAIMVAHMHSV